VFAPLAHADCNTAACDQQFMSVLQQHGVARLYTDPANGAIMAGHVACGELQRGESVIQVQLNTVDRNQNLSRADASWVVAAAQQVYCP
ncbi:MAG: DUF732 domain-containing protein, partial [Mycolicibacterium sp.]|nr:DUF732 domain-containing protein [Mycolicibacterium sp.]